MNVISHFCLGNAHPPLICKDSPNITTANSFTDLKSQEYNRRVSCMYDTNVEYLVGNTFHYILMVTFIFFLIILFCSSLVSGCYHGQWLQAT